MLRFFVKFDIIFISCYCIVNFDFDHFPCLLSDWVRTPSPVKWVPQNLIRKDLTLVKILLLFNTPVVDYDLVTGILSYPKYGTDKRSIKFRKAIAIYSKVSSQRLIELKENVFLFVQLVGILILGIAYF